MNPPYKSKRISLTAESKNSWIFNGTSTREVTTEEVGTKYKTNIRETCERITGPARYNGNPASFATALKQGTLIGASDASVKNGIGAGAWVLATQELENTMGGAGPIDGDPATMQSTRAERGATIGSLYAILGVAKDYNLRKGQATLYVDNQGSYTKGKAPEKGEGPIATFERTMTKK